MQNILVVGNYNREDFVNLFIACNSYCKLYFLEFSSQKEINNKYHSLFGKAIFWGDYKDAFELIDKTKPSKIVFFFIESYHHVALRLACKVRNLETFLIDHGLRDLNINIRLEPFLLPQKESIYNIYYKRATQFYSRFRARLFIINTTKLLPGEEADFFRAFVKIRRRKSFWETYKIIPSPLRTADSYIAFSPKTYEVHRILDYLPADQQVHFIGIPIFDHLSSLEPVVLEKNILFIDQGLAERGIFGWTQAKYDQFIKQLVTIAAKYGFNLHLKPHPRQIPPSHNNIRLVNDEDMLHLIPKTPIVLGFASTYLLPLIAQQHTTVITLENHPIGKLNVSKSFIDVGVAHPVYDLEELHTLLPNIDELHQKQLPNKAKFTEEWMYKFDGKAGERLRDILLSDEV
ncbi:polysialyltransferase family glycosyltransferase [Pontibacter sp. MBLB2868]|uniref:polysialyltransferase family glycosyltransferase n=1 Tax=Pontibacter sp. MBLB2868 TaxID=3451555 RepID=UPI003F753CC9